MGLDSRTRWSFGVGHVLNDLCASAWFSYFLVFMRHVVLLAPATTGFLILIGQVADGLATPIVGILSDKTTSKFGKRRLWIGVGSFVVFWSFLPILQLNWFGWTNDLAVVSYYTLFIIIFQIGWASVQVSHLALVPELAHDEQERVSLNSLRSTFTILSGVAVYVLAYELLGRQGEQNLGPEDAPSFKALSWYIVLIGGLFSALFAIGVGVPPEKPEQPASSAHHGVRWHEWLNNPDFYRVGTIYMSTRVMSNVSQAYVPVYLLETLGAPKTAIATVPFTIFVGSFLATTVGSPITHLLGSSGVTGFGAFLVFLSSVGLGLLPAAQFHLVYFLALLLGFGCGLVLFSVLSLIGDLFEDRNCPSTAFVYGAMSLFDKLANGAAIMIIQVLAPPHGDARTSKYYADVMFYVPSVPALLAILLVCPMMRPKPNYEPLGDIKYT
jgi:Na+/melibiose symporter-like transporter